MGADPPPFPSGRMRLRGFELARLPTDFGDWGGEVRACRTAAALFDFSCLVTIEARGSGAAALLESYCGRSLGDMAVGAIRYALTADDTHRLVSDLTVWRTASNRFLVMTGRAEDFATLGALASDHAPTAAAVTVEDMTERSFVLALQGPAAAARLVETFGLTLPPRFRFVRARLGFDTCLVGRIGYTGEDGVEVLCPGPAAVRLWAALARFARPAGFRAADRLRLEAGLPLFAQEFAPGVRAAEAGFATIRNLAVEPPPDLVRIRAFARPSGKSLRRESVPARERPSRGEMAVTSVVPWEEGTTLLMGYARRQDRSDSTLRDPAANFHEIRPIAARGLLRDEGGSTS